MNHEPLDLISRVARKINKMNDFNADGFAHMDQSMMVAIPGLNNLMQNIYRLRENLHLSDIDAELRHHMALINKDGPVHMAIRVLTNPDDVDRVMAPPMQQFDSAIKRTIEDLTVNPKDLIEAFDHTRVWTEVPAPQKEMSWGGDLLTGLSPSKFQAVNGFEILDYFPVNEKPFYYPISEQPGYRSTPAVRYEYPLLAGDFEPTDYYAMIHFSDGVIQGKREGYSFSTNIRVEVYQRGMAHWSVRTHYQLTWDTSWTAGLTLQRTPIPHQGVYNFPMSRLMQFAHGNSGMGRLDYPQHWQHLDGLSEYVEMWDHAENVIHFGMEKFVPKKALRQALHRFLTDNGYYVPTGTLTNEQIAEELLEITKKLPFFEDGTYHVNKRSDFWSYKAVLAVRKEEMDPVGYPDTVVTFGLAFDSDHKLKPNMDLLQHLDKMDLVRYEAPLYGTGTPDFPLRVVKQEDGTHRVVMPGNTHLSDRTLNSLMIFIRWLTKTVRVDKSGQ